MGNFGRIREVALATPKPLQRKQLITPTDDAGEREADDVARQITSGLGAMMVQSAISGQIQRRNADHDVTALAPEVELIESERGRGAPLHGQLRRAMQRSFGADFSAVRIHTGPSADRLNRSLSARAFTTGHDVFFRSGEFSNTGQGTQLLAHELTHVVQQQGAQAAIQRQTNNPATGGGGGGVAGTPAPRVVYIDANVVDQINRGNQPAAQALQQMRASGTVVRIAPFQYNEAVVQPDIPRTATANRLILEEMSIQQGAAPTLAQRVDVNLAGQTAAGGNIMQLRDQQLVASARAEGGAVEIWSFDTPFTSNPAQVQGTYGVRVAPESQLPIATGRSDYRVGRQLLGLQPVEISLTGQVTRTPPPGGGGGAPGGGVPPAPPPPGVSAAGTGPSAGARAVAGGLALIVVLNEVLGGINRVRNVQQQNIDLGEAQLAFWERFGAKPVRGVWDLVGKHPLPPGTTPETSVFGSPSFPYVVDIDVQAFRSALPSRIDSYQDFLYFLDAARQLETIEEDPPMPNYPTREQKAQARHYYAWVNKPDRANQRVYDITDVVVQVQNASLAELGEAMREQTRALPPGQQALIYRLRHGPETPIYRSAGGGQPIITAQQVFGPDPWVRTIGRQQDVGGWFSTDIRTLVVPANADAQRVALVSGYYVKQPIEDTYDEVRKAGRPILDRQPKDGPISSFVAGPEPGVSRFGQTRYYRHTDPDFRWTVAIGELREFWVKASDLDPVPPADIKAYIGG
jgi:Domain of unknown function (DUF4157)